MIAWVAEAAAESSRIDRVIVATDDERIAAAARAAGAEARMTRGDHPTGTDRVAEAVQGVEADVVLNLQGDEPAVRPDALNRLAAAFESPEVCMATLAVKGVSEADRSNPMIVKIVVDRNGDALYFSRGPVPFRSPLAEPLGGSEVEPESWKHVGTYGFRSEALSEFVREERRGIEEVEDLEQLRALDLGWKIRVVEIEEAPICVDLPADVAAVESILRARGEEVKR
jgi:3-deoxy-manno-octulosonate cytidylyltransferase (CMP-KDO synthetase)